MFPARIQCATLGWHAGIDSLVRYYEHDNRHVHRSLHAFSIRAAGADGGARTRIAKFIHVTDPAEIIFTRGTVNPTAEFCRRARAVGAITVIDAVQSIGHAPFDVQALGAACGYLDAPGRDQIAAHHIAPSQLAMEELSAIPAIRIIGPRTGDERSGPARPARVSIFTIP